MEELNKEFILAAAIKFTYGTTKKKKKKKSLVFMLVK